MPRLRMRCVPDATADVKALLHLLRRPRTAPCPKERFTLDRAAAAERLARFDAPDPSPSLYEPTDLEVAAAARALLAILDGADLASEARELVDARELVEVALANMLSLFLIESTDVRARFIAVSSNSSIAELLTAIGLLGGDIDDPALNIFAKHASGDVAALAVRRFFPEHGRWFVRRTPPPRSFAQIARRLFG